MHRHGIEYFEEPEIAKKVFASRAAAVAWLIARVYIGWEFFAAGWGKVFGGTITWRFWNWGDPAYSLTGRENIGWIRAGDVAQNGQVVHLSYGDNIASFAHRGIEAAPHPDVAYGWYVDFLARLDHPRPLPAGREVVRGIRCKACPTTTACYESTSTPGWPGSRSTTHPST